MSKHTKEKLEIVEYGGVNRRGFIVCHSRTFEGCTEVARVKGDKDMAKAKADATLLAAAPVLLAALESVKSRGFDNECANGWGFIHITRKDWNSVIAAIDAAMQS